MNLNKKKKVTILGKALSSTIATMDSLGPIGHEVLKEFGILKIDESKSYPIEIRNAIHKAVLDKYGSIALIDIGFKNGELAHEGLIKPVAELSQKEAKGLGARNISKRLIALEKVFSYFVKVGDKFIKKMTDGSEAKYGHTYEKIKDFQFKLKATMALAPYAEPFMHGVIQRRLSEVFGKYFEYELKFLSDLTISGYGFSTWYWLLKFNEKKSNLSTYQIINEKEKEINKSMMKVVLAKAFEQNKKMENISKKIAKYIPPQINDALFRGDYDTKIETKRKKLTIFFSDIKNFTSVSENLQPEDLTKYLNEYFSEMTSIALEHGGTIDKYIGDAMMIFFGDPNTNGERQDARDCLEMALSMQEKMKLLQNKWKNEGFAEPFQIRIGINTGYCNVGNFGSAQRLTYTIIGGEVNVTQRLEGNADPNGILMSYETFAHTQDMVEVEERKKIKMKGINKEVKSFAVKKRKLNIKKTKNKKKTINKAKNLNIVNNENIEERVLKIEQNIKHILKKISNL